MAEQEKKGKNKKMQVKHIKNLYWLIFVIALVMAIGFSSNPFFLWTGIITAIFSLVSILVGKPALMWLFWGYIIIINLPFAIPFLLLALIVKLFGKGIQCTIYTWASVLLAIGELISAVALLGGYGWCFVGSVIFCPFLVYGAIFDDEVSK